eukprot:TRINITY_DN3071_c0_g1_i1.p1 TRINITY_DN3071_c0_g1~~TRINITY_DN3071_c0_g1_i1.p1  ORF type:complete len:176 (+),score=31.13 TRINITY_DN3071_c0_g1_i1:54-581(+)
MGGLLLYVRLHGQVIPVDAEPDATVQQLMQRVAEAVGGEPPLLQFQGADLNPEDLISDTGVSQEATLDAVRRRVFRYEHDFDENGLFYYIGTLGLQEPWKNPDSERRLVSCQKKPEWFSPSSSPASNLVGREGSYSGAGILLPVDRAAAGRRRPCVRTSKSTSAEWAASPRRTTH